MSPFYQGVSLLTTIFYVSCILWARVSTGDDTTWGSIIWTVTIATAVLVIFVAGMVKAFMLMGAIWVNVIIT